MTNKYLEKISSIIGNIPYGKKPIVIGAVLGAAPGAFIKTHKDEDGNVVQTSVKRRLLNTAGGALVGGLAGLHWSHGDRKDAIREAKEAVLRRTGSDIRQAEKAKQAAREAEAEAARDSMRNQ